MTKEQKTVAIGAASGVVLMVLGVWAFTRIVPAPTFADGIAERIAYGLVANVVAVLPLWIVLMAIGNARALSAAIDPTLGAETRAIDINRRVAANTLEQGFVFAIATLALSVTVPLANLQVVWACAIVFVIARLAFWIGYRIHPLHRAAGMAATAYLNLGIIAYVLYRAVTR